MSTGNKAALNVAKVLSSADNNIMSLVHSALDVSNNLYNFA